MALPLLWVDAFADGPFTGNPAAVVLLERPAPDAWMQRVAAELGLSETAFVVPREGDFDLRWFTPTTEVDLCGHATLASAHALWHAGRLPPEARARFHTRSGPLRAVRADDLVWIDLPALPPTSQETSLPGLTEALGAEPRGVYRSRFDVLVELDDADAVRALRPDPAALARLAARGVIVTAHADEPGTDFVSRFFAPSVGVPEDPVTGSAHCVLAPFWARRLGRPTLTARQVSPRGGTLRLRLEDGRVHLGGRAVTVLEAHLLPEP